MASGTGSLTALCTGGGSSSRAEAIRARTSGLSTASAATLLMSATRVSCDENRPWAPGRTNASWFITVMTRSVVRPIIVQAKPLRQVPRTPAIFCSCGLRPEFVVSLPNQEARWRIVAMTVTPRAKRLKSRSLAMSNGLRKLSPGTRSSITGSIVVPQL